MQNYKFYYQINIQIYYVFYMKNTNSSKIDKNFTIKYVRIKLGKNLFLYCENVIPVFFFFLIV